ncbi:MAG: succinate dehydrogenase, hydrophobic membrane anchor protein [Gammaproteobacteria bacterium]|nr:succinate dehydrogenase, hydrophobic membrane anchor protein [Gammaproteobacteria bacterium]
MSWRAQGFRAWLLQRFTAIYMLLFLIWFFCALWINSPVGYIEWRTWLGSTTVAIPVTIFFIALLMHAWVGMRDVIIDYMHVLAVRLVLLSIVGLSLLYMALWVMQVLFRAVL